MAVDARGKSVPARLLKAPAGLRIEVDDAEAEYPLTLDPLLTTAAWTAESNQADSNFGISVASAGDVNGDGFSDVIVGAHLFDNGQTNEGRVTLYLGSAAGLETVEKLTQVKLTRASPIQESPTLASLTPERRTAEKPMRV